MHLSILLALLLAGALGHAQQKTENTNPCADPQSQVEMNQCAVLQYKNAAALNSLYKHINFVLQKDLDNARRDKDPDLIKYCETALTDLKEPERAWIQYRDLHCKAAEQQ